MSKLHFHDVVVIPHTYPHSHGLIRQRLLNRSIVDLHTHHVISDTFVERGHTFRMTVQAKLTNSARSVEVNVSLFLPTKCHSRLSVKVCPLVHPIGSVKPAHRGNQHST